VKMQKEKVDRVLSWPAPKNAKKVQKFLGLTNYYRQFIKDLLELQPYYIYWLERKKSGGEERSRRKHSNN